MRRAKSNVRGFSNPAHLIEQMKRFTLRDLFWLILVAAIGFGWLMDRKEWQKTEDAYLRLLDECRRGK